MQKIVLILAMVQKLQKCKYMLKRRGEVIYHLCRFYVVQIALPAMQRERCSRCVSMHFLAGKWPSGHRA